MQDIFQDQRVGPLKEAAGKCTAGLEQFHHDVQQVPNVMWVGDIVEAAVTDHSSKRSILRSKVKPVPVNCPLRGRVARPDTGNHRRFEIDSDEGFKSLGEFRICGAIKKLTRSISNNICLGLKFIVKSLIKYENIRKYLFPILFFLPSCS